MSLLIQHHSMSNGSGMACRYQSKNWSINQYQSTNQSVHQSILLVRAVHILQPCDAKHYMPLYAPINVKLLGGRPGIGGGFDSSHHPIVGTFDHFNGLSSSILLTFSCYFDNPRKILALFKCPAYARPPPQQLNVDRCIILEAIIHGYMKCGVHTCKMHPSMQ